MKAGKVVLALDGMGGDHAPDVVVNGADIARERYPDTSYLLFGDPEKLKPLVDKRKGLAQAVEIVPAADAVSADDKPSFALRRRRQSSMWLACQAAAEGRADTVVSAGNTGALLAISMFAMRMLDGAHRPALASFLPTTRGETVMLDLGANLECDADNLAEFAVMGSVFAQVLLGLDAPKVGLLNVGSEELKGHEELRQAAGWLRRAGRAGQFPRLRRRQRHRFRHGRRRGDRRLHRQRRAEVDRRHGKALYRLRARRVPDLDLRQDRLSLLPRARWVKLRKRVDPRRYNGGVFLGLDGVCVKSHGGTDDLGFAYAIGVARDMVRYEYKSKLVEGLAKLRQVAATPDAPEEAVQASGGTA